MVYGYSLDNYNMNTNTQKDLIFFKRGEQFIIQRRINYFPYEELSFEDEEKATKKFEKMDVNSDL
jgi:hypothetical protein